MQHSDGKAYLEIVVGLIVALLLLAGHLSDRRASRRADAPSVEAN